MEQAQFDAVVDTVTYEQPTPILTTCTLLLFNGATVIGRHFASVPKQYDRIEGEVGSLCDARAEVARLENYLKLQLDYEASLSSEARATITAAKAAKAVAITRVAIAPKPDIESVIGGVEPSDLGLTYAAGETGAVVEIRAADAITPVGDGGTAWVADEQATPGVREEGAKDDAGEQPVADADTRFAVNEEGVFVEGGYEPRAVTVVGGEGDSPASER